MPLERGESLVWYFGMLLVFLLAHLLSLALDRAAVAAHRLSLRYMAHFGSYYAGHDNLLSPMRITRRYTAELPHAAELADEPLPAEGEEVATGDTDATVTKL